MLSLGLCCGVQQRGNKASVSVTKSAGFCFENAALEYAAERRSAPIERMGVVVKHPMSQIIRVATAGRCFFKFDVGCPIVEAAAMNTRSTRL